MLLSDLIKVLSPSEIVEVYEYKKYDEYPHTYHNPYTEPEFSEWHEWEVLNLWSYCNLFEEEPISKLYVGVNHIAKQ